MYSIVIASSAEKELRRLDRAVQSRITAAILALGDNPRPAGCLKIKTEEGAWRIRIGDYRVAYIIDDQAKLVTVMRVGSRGNFYN